MATKKVKASDVFRAVDEDKNCRAYEELGIVVCHLTNTEGGEG